MITMLKIYELMEVIGELIIIVAIMRNSSEIMRRRR
jgi:hypothetical protein